MDADGPTTISMENMPDDGGSVSDQRRQEMFDRWLDTELDKPENWKWQGAQRLTLEPPPIGPENINRKQQKMKEGDEASMALAEARKREKGKEKEKETNNDVDTRPSEVGGNKKRKNKFAPLKWYDEKDTTETQSEDKGWYFQDGERRVENEVAVIERVTIKYSSGKARYETAWEMEEQKMQESLQHQLNSSQSVQIRSASNEEPCEFEWKGMEPYESHPCNRQVAQVWYDDGKENPVAHPLSDEFQTNSNDHALSSWDNEFDGPPPDVVFSTSTRGLSATKLNWVAGSNWDSQFIARQIGWACIDSPPGRPLSGRGHGMTAEKEWPLQENTTGGLEEWTTEMEAGSPLATKLAHDNLNEIKSATKMKILADDLCRPSGAHRQAVTWESGSIVTDFLKDLPNDDNNGEFGSSQQDAGTVNDEPFTPIMETAMPGAFERNVNQPRYITVVVPSSTQPILSNPVSHAFQMRAPAPLPFSLYDQNTERFSLSVPSELNVTASNPTKLYCDNNESSPGRSGLASGTLSHTLDDMTETATKGQTATISRERVGGMRTFSRSTSTQPCSKPSAAHSSSRSSTSSDLLQPVEVTDFLNRLRKHSIATSLDSTDAPPVSRESALSVGATEFVPKSPGYPSISREQTWSSDTEFVPRGFEWQQSPQDHGVDVFPNIDSHIFGSQQTTHYTHHQPVDQMVYNPGYAYWPGYDYPPPSVPEWSQQPRQQIHHNPYNSYEPTHYTASTPLFQIPQQTKKAVKIEASK
ncbi:hypothetical protein BC936DRAFT_147861 [Jimgerdemannia flammicorona]|uniref:Uncharacterized protein n=1 Tax=Jimgerdemannia flammicorona TaxID=994334 RepID=A0A433D4B4_9FUNG|nr:hypothetical protein BC936DRAFT_147861 [Jimgerdemannia flammicorona]